MKVSTRRLRKNINAADAIRAYHQLLDSPTNQAIDNYVSGLVPPGSSQFTLTADDYDAARYLLAVVHCSYVKHPDQVFVDVLMYKLNNETDEYKDKLEKLERMLVSKNLAPETSVQGPKAAAVKTARVLSPVQKSQHDIDNQGGERVRFV